MTGRQMTSRTECVDVAIVGGGLAGLTLALQLRQTSPELTILILEKNSYPPPPAAHKVGESTVEVGAHYLGQILGLKDLLTKTQLRKFGLRFFVGSGFQSDLSGADELGVSEPFTPFSYQLDRGTLENDLIDLARERQIEVRFDCHISDVAITAAESRNTLTVSNENDESTVQCDWVVDATGRSALLKRKLAMRKPSDHKICAAWFRLDKSVSIDDWSDDADWKSRCSRSRRLSTNHLMGCGYWAWIIPLVNDRTSIGLVTDPEIHPLSTYDRFDKLRLWLRNNQPMLADRVDDGAAELMDFMKLRNFSHRSEQVWSPDRWALTGVSGFFADPFYSPGTDFIALANTYITDLITRDCSTSETNMRTMIYAKLYQSFYDATMTIYQNQYAGFGDTRLICVKQTWDYAYYWSILAWLFFRDVLTDLPFLRGVQNQFGQIQAINQNVQMAFRQRAAERHIDRGEGRFIDPTRIPVLAELNAALLAPVGSPEQELKKNCARLERLAPMLLSLLDGQSASGNSAGDLLGDLELRLR
jgi:flavin-dependent dehydrogenase